MSELCEGPIGTGRAGIDSPSRSAPHAAHPSVSVRIYIPTALLEPYVTFFYFVEADQPLQDFLYPEWGNVRFAMQGDWMVQVPGFNTPAKQEAVLYGPTDRHGVVTTSGGKTIGSG